MYHDFPTRENIWYVCPILSKKHQFNVYPILYIAHNNFQNVEMLHFSEITPPINHISETNGVPIYCFWGGNYGG